MIELIVNPAAGGGLALETAKKAEEWLQAHSVAYQLHLTERPGHAAQLAAEAAERGADTVVACGGDGTVTETASGLRGTKTALGILPCGTGNDFVKTSGIPRKPEDALAFLLSHPARPVNSGMANDRFFLNECGTGFDVMVLDYAEKAKKRFHGLIPYLYGVIRAIGTFRPLPMHIEIGDDVVMDGRYMICAIANGRYIGGGIPIAPDADPSDGLLDVLVVDELPSWKLPFYLPSLMRGTLQNKRVSHRYLVKRCLLRTEGMRLNMDGEICPVSEVRFDCEENQLLLHW